MKIKIFGSILLVICFIVAISGCTDNTQQYGKKIYQGNWKVDASHFAIPQETIDGFSGEYTAYQNGSTITLIGMGKQISLQNDTTHKIMTVLTQDGQNVNTTYYLDGKLGGYSYTNQTTTDQMFENSKKIWEGSRTTADEQLSSELYSRTINVKL